ncbi:MAG: undecaprenyldiphospho-muramoylpentapeptide beta-N-acetylglucosaminyltransferase [Granulosicoccaceae bacterium]
MSGIKKVMIAAGGTGGHVVPALSVAQELQRRGFNVVWLGTQAGIEARLVPESGIEMEWLAVSGLRGKGWQAWLLAPFKLLRACWQAGRAVIRHKPTVLLGMGGFVAGPGGLMAKILGKKLVIHEQNAVVGTTNRLLARVADVVLAAMPSAFVEQQGARCVGNPVREDLSLIDDPSVRLNRGDNEFRVLVVGGSQGAGVFNEVVPAAAQEVGNIQLWHQTGRAGVEQTQAAYDSAGVEARVVPFIDDMAEAYSWADLVVSRAGAMSVSELAASGCASVLVPYPYAIDDHQTANCALMVREGAAVLVPQPRFDAQLLTKILMDLRDDRPRLVTMAKAARGLAKPNATREVAEIILENTQ